MLDRQKIEDAIRTNYSFTSTLVALDKAVTGSSVRNLKRYVVKYCIDVSHFKRLERKKYKSKNLLVCDPTLKNRRSHQQLKRCLLELGREYKCESCGIDSWKGGFITFEIDHIDGRWFNNDPTNLRFLCPNCHSQTSNFYHTKTLQYCECGNQKSKKASKCIQCSNKIINLKNRKVDRPSREELEILLTQKRITEIAKSFNVSDKAIIKWCKSYGLSRPGRGFWQRKDNACRSGNGLHL